MTLTACITSVYQTQVSLPKVESYYKRDHWLLRANGVGFEACESVFLSTSIGFVLVSGQTGEEPEQAPLLDYNNRTSTTTRLLLLFDGPGLVHIRRRRRTQATTHVCFCFCSTEVFVSSEVFVARQIFFEGFTPIPTGSKSFWSRDWFARDWVTWDWFEEFLVTSLIHIHVGLIHVGLNE